VFFRPIFVFVFIELATRKVMHAATTRFPSHAWVNAAASQRDSLRCGPSVLDS
jgi:hypothetical protein